MTIYENIRADFIKSRKNKDGMSAFYSTLIGEMDNEASRSKTGRDITITDEIAIKVLKTFSKNLQETFKAEGGDNYTTVLEIEIVDFHLPVQMNEEKLREVIADSNLQSMGEIMAYLKTNYAGLYDGKMASTVAKEFL